MQAAPFWGIDGCKTGWLAIARDEEKNWWAEVFSDFSALGRTAQSAQRVLVDIPIGLPTHQARRCDTLARQRLQARRSSVFPVPSRAALQAPDYRSGCDRNQALMGKRISKQAWNIGPKILEVDRWLLQHDPRQQQVRECHPELALMGLNHGVPMAHNKKKTEGQQERLHVLRRHWTAVDEIFHELLKRFPRRAVAPDDILDALALTLTAAQAPALVALPPEPEYDEQGLRMEITYGQFE